MAEGELREAVIRYVKKCYKANKKVPSIRKTCKHFKKENLSRRYFYRIFPRGIREVCKLAAVPVPKERVKRTEKATKASKRRIQVEKDLSEVKDERVKRDLAEALEWERRGDKARARLKAKEMKRKAKLEALKSEAELDPKKIPTYIEALDEPHLNQVLGDMRKACKLEKISLKVGCVKAVEAYGSRGRAEKETFEGYVGRCLDLWAEWVRWEAARVKYGKVTFDCLCLKCHVKYAYMKYSLNRFRCPDCWTEVYFPCPVCKEAFSSEEHLEYNPKANTLCCFRCGSSFNARPPAMGEYGTVVRMRSMERRRQRPSETTDSDS